MTKKEMLAKIKARLEERGVNDFFVNDCIKTWSKKKKSYVENIYTLQFLGLNREEV